MLEAWVRDIAYKGSVEVDAISALSAGDSRFDVLFALGREFPATLNFRLVAFAPRADSSSGPATIFGSLVFRFFTTGQPGTT